MKLVAPSTPLRGEVELPVSKSIANRFQIIAALAGKNISFPDSAPEDVITLRNALAATTTEVNVGMAGTAMRFLTAYFSIVEERQVLLVGNSRMYKRPIEDLVKALQLLGAGVSYLEEYGFPPLSINGKNLLGGTINMSASVSSQFVSALMMIACKMKSGLTINLNGKVLSRPYIELSASCIRQCGIDVHFNGNTIRISSGEYKIPTLNIEADWSSASYFYSLICANPKSKLLLKGLNLNSIQGDSIISEWFKPLGVSSTQKENGVEIYSSGDIDFPLEMDFKNNPDLAQTFAFLAACLGKELKLTGLDNLRLKETDRISALRTELEKLGLEVLVADNSLEVRGAIKVDSVTIQTYNDHRMAMSAVVLSNRMELEILNPEVVCKSFPAFWNELSRVVK